MFNGLKIKPNSIKLSSFVGGAAIAAATLALTGTALPASAASITYSNWANIGPQRIGDADNGKFTLKVTDGADVGATGKALFQFKSVSLAANNLISEVYFNDASGLFKKDTISTPVYGKGQEKNTIVSYDTTVNYQPYASVASTSGGLSTSLNGLDFVYNDNITLPQGNSINVQKPNFGFNRNGGNTNSISVGETLGILVDLADGKDFTSVLNALTQTNGLIVAAHIIGYPNPNDKNNGLSDGFYYGNPGLTTTPPAGTDSAIFYDSYKTPTDPNPVTRTTAPGQAVPEPLTILGAATAAGFGASFKRRLAKVKGNQKAD
jgi:hypothetical protein